MNQRVEKVVRHLRREIECGLDVHVVRSLVDGRYVFLHVRLSRRTDEAKRAAACLFETKTDGAIVDRGRVITTWRDCIPSGRGLMDGETRIRDLDRTAANKEVVRAFITDGLRDGNIHHLSRYVSSRTFFQHNLLLEDGLAALAGFLSGKKARGETFRYEKILHLIGQGNFVVSLCAVRSGEDDLRIFDIFRLEDGKIVEHWSNSEIRPPED